MMVYRIFCLSLIFKFLRSNILFKLVYLKFGLENVRWNIVFKEMCLVEFKGILWMLINLRIF